MHVLCENDIFLFLIFWKKNREIHDYRYLENITYRYLHRIISSSSIEFCNHWILTNILCFQSSYSIKEESQVTVNNNNI